MHFRFLKFCKFAKNLRVGLDIALGNTLYHGTQYYLHNQITLSIPVHMSDDIFRGPYLSVHRDVLAAMGRPLTRHRRAVHSVLLLFAVVGGYGPRACVAGPVTVQQTRVGQAIHVRWLRVGACQNQSLSTKRSHDCFEWMIKHTS